VSEALNLSFKSSLELNKIIDEKIPCSRPRFNHYQVVVGSETCDVYFRNAIQCIQALLSDTSLSPQMIFAPEKHYTDDSKTSRMYHDMHTGKWWWATQVRNAICTWHQSLTCCRRKRLKKTYLGPRLSPSSYQQTRPNLLYSAIRARTLFISRSGIFQKKSDASHQHVLMCFWGICQPRS
jgi:hypothetical protein